MSIVTVTPKGQVMIPASLRKRLGIKPGLKVLVEVEDETLIIRPLPENPVDALYGILLADPIPDTTPVRRRRAPVALVEVER